ncbi:MULTISPECIES: hypothetical protein [Lysinibacillus]|uniref:Uncharacterized protein n=1 Tax=Lysinibacillus capsici TaxID=2115968 RepID=A0ABY8KK42_9BACI|nr:hypothetical protein [Lysinibacillus capsici]WGF39864.1 hypothetical protein QBO96_06255 [Lysinibacillus capsici]
MNYKTIVPVRFLFKRRPDDVEIVGVSNLFLIREEHEALTDEMVLKLLRDQGCNVIRLIREGENVIGVDFKQY